MYVYMHTVFHVHASDYKWLLTIISCNSSLKSLCCICIFQFTVNITFSWKYRERQKCNNSDKDNLPRCNRTIRSFEQRRLDAVFREIWTLSTHERDKGRAKTISPVGISRHTDVLVAEKSGSTEKAWWTHVHWSEAKANGTFQAQTDYDRRTFSVLQETAATRREYGRLCSWATKASWHVNSARSWTTHCGTNLFVAS